METALKLQMDVRNNATDLQNYMCDLNNWEEEMKRKESELNNKCQAENRIPPPRNKIKRSKSENEKHSNKAKKISAYDYSAWDKFDVEKACAEIDDNDSNEEKSEEDVSEAAMNSNTEKNDNDSNNKSNDLSLIDEAFYEKEMGNQFVKKEQWADALKCYTNAINLDSKNAIYYANRSLCFLKLKNFKAAETDATTAIQLDKNYVKAYQRRAFARQALGQLPEAKSDHEEILKLEPKNALSRVEINKIEDYLKKNVKISKPSEKKTFNPKNMFKTEDKKVETKKSPNTSNKVQETHKLISSKSETNINKNSNSVTSDSKSKAESTKKVNKQTVVSNNENTIFEKGGDGEQMDPDDDDTKVEEIFKPLPEWCKIIHPVDLPPHKRSKKPLRRINITIVDKDEDINITQKGKAEDLHSDEKKEEKIIVNKPNDIEESWNERLSLDIPKTAIQFQKCWKMLKKHPEEAYGYLKKIPGMQLPLIFENSLESDFFSELITFLANDDIKKEAGIVYEFLLGLSSVKRFSSLTLFMSEADRRCLKKCLTQLEGSKSQEEISQLYKLYELKV